MVWYGMALQECLSNIDNWYVVTHLHQGNGIISHIQTQLRECKTSIKARNSTIIQVHYVLYIFLETTIPTIEEIESTFKAFINNRKKRMNNLVR